MSGGRDDHVVAHRFEDADGRAVQLRVGDHRRQVVGRVGTTILGERDEVLEEVLQRLHELFGRGAAGHLRVGGAEQLLGELQAGGGSPPREAEDREDHVQRVVDGDVGDEVAFAPEVGHAVDIPLGELGDALVETRQRLRKEPVRRDVPVDGMIGSIHVDESPQHIPGGGALVIAGLRAKEGTGRVEPPLVLPFDLHHVGVLGHRVEGIEVLGFDAVHGRLAPEQRACRVEARLVRVCGRIGEDPPGLLDGQVDHIGFAGHAPTLKDQWRAPTTRSSSRCSVMWAMSATAFSKTASFAFDGVR